MKNTISILLLIGITILLNLLAKDFFFRLDLTEDKQYTLSGATKDILRDLDNPVTVKAYFSKDLPTEVAKIGQNLQDVLKEYATLSKGMLDYEFISPETETEKQEAAQAGIQPILIQVREKDQMKQQQAFLGATIEVGEQKEILSSNQLSGGLEYELSTGIKKVSVSNKPSVGIIQGHGEASLNELVQAYQALNILNEVEAIDLGSEASIADRFRAVAIIAPKDTFPADHLAKLDDYLGRGGKLVVAINTVDGNLSNAQGSAVNTGLEIWLRNKGVQVENSFLIDASCSSVGVQQPNFPIPVQIQFPFLPSITTFADHPITEGLEQVILPFASPINWLGDTSSNFTPLAFSSSQAGKVNPPTFFDVTREWTTADFPNSGLVVAGLVEGNLVGNMASKIIVIGDGDFSVNRQGQGQSQDNINLFVNSIDWLSDDTGLIELRTKGVSTRPIKQEILADDASGKRNWYKYLNFGLPILLVILYGFFRSQRQRELRLRRMQERYV